MANIHSGAQPYQPLPQFRGLWFGPGEILISGDLIIAPDGNWYRVIIDHRTAATFDHFAADPNGTGALVYALLLNPPPIGDVSSAEYFTTTRGALSLQHLALRARAHLVAQSRVYKVDFECRFERAAGLSCRKNALVYDFELPGGQAFGKIVRYGIKGNGDTGAVTGYVSIAGSPGYGASYVPVVGEPTCCDADCLGPDCQYYAGACTALGTGDVMYTPPAYVPIDDGLVFPLDKAQAVVAETVIVVEDPIKYTVSSLITSRKEGFGADFGPVLAAQDLAIALQRTQAIVSAARTSYTLTLRPVQNGPFAAEYDLKLTNLQLPKQIDLSR